MAEVMIGDRRVHSAEGVVMVQDVERNGRVELKIEKSGGVMFLTVSQVGQMPKAQPSSGGLRVMRGLVVLTGIVIVWASSELSVYLVPLGGS